MCNAHPSPLVLCPFPGFPVGEVVAANPHRISALLPRRPRSTSSQISDSDELHFFLGRIGEEQGYTRSGAARAHGSENELGRGIEGQEGR